MLIDIGDIVFCIDDDNQIQPVHVHKVFRDGIMNNCLVVYYNEDIFINEVDALINLQVRLELELQRIQNKLTNASLRYNQFYKECV